MNVKNVVNLISFSVGGVLGYLFGPCDVLLQSLLVFMALDIITGLMAAATGHSTKTEGGKLSSQAMFNGIMKKGAELIMVIVGNVLDMVTGMTIIRAGVCSTLIVSEVLSITENATLLGVIDIPIINKALEILKEKSDTDLEE